MKKPLILSMTICFLSIFSISNAREATGQKKFSDQLVPNTFNVFTFHLNVNEVSQIKVIGDGQSNLDCTLQNSRSEVISVDMDPTDVCFLAPFITKEDNYTLTVWNHGNNNSVFVVEVN